MGSRLRKNHGCQTIPLTEAMIRALQLSDPRCSPPNQLNETDKKALQDLGEVLKKISTAGVEGPK